MNTLNLIRMEKGNLKYRISKFPDGQQNIVVEYAFIDKTLITTRLRNWMDLELLCCAVASLKEFGIDDISVEISYFVGARSDRKFSIGGNNYLKSVICPIINLLGFRKVSVLDPHSNCLEMGINNFESVSNVGFISSVISDSLFLNKTSFVAPDAGALHKIFSTLSLIGKSADNVICCTKERNVFGDIIGTTVPSHEPTKAYLIIDDICDGGNTFISISKALRDLNPDAIICLAVTHGIFSSGVEKVADYFDVIYCTNSYSDIDYVKDITSEIGSPKREFLQYKIY